MCEGEEETCMYVIYFEYTDTACLFIDDSVYRWDVFFFFSVRMRVSVRT